MEIADSGRKHGVADADILHAIRLPMRRITQGTDRMLIIAADRSGQLLEIVVIDPDGDHPAVIHAMPLRPKFHRYL
ncbi:MAG TPA: hypothetical protein VM367_01885 [Pseudonocardia sp.]|nr:hypothetical protein [Pseudonocardia sp.]